VAFIGTGAPSSSLGVHPLELQDYSVHDNRMHARIVAASGVEEIAEVIPIDFRQRCPSPEIYFAEWRELAVLCHRLGGDHPISRASSSAMARRASRRPPGS